MPKDAVGNSARTRLEQERRTVERKLMAISVSRDELMQEKKELERRNRKLETLIDAYFFVRGDIKITEHAMLRYLERVKGLDVEALVDLILDVPGIAGTVRTVGTGIIPLESGVYARVIKGHIVTILTKKEKEIKDGKGYTLGR